MATVPPTTGPGSSRAAWVEFLAEETGQPESEFDGLGRDDLIALHENGPATEEQSEGAAKLAAVLDKPDEVTEQDPEDVPEETPVSLELGDRVLYRHPNGYVVPGVVVAVENVETGRPPHLLPHGYRPERALDSGEVHLVVFSADPSHPATPVFNAQVADLLR